MKHLPWKQNRSNYHAHLNGTGPEIWRQTNGRVHAFVSGVGNKGFYSSLAFSHISSLGTGGTIAGVGQYLKSKNKDVIVALSDPEGSGLYNKV